ncbi:MAG: toll/interleukin-1 receptor domain-containing protein, partial [Cyanobacteria bacterium J06648_11]
MHWQAQLIDLLADLFEPPELRRFIAAHYTSLLKSIVFEAVAPIDVAERTIGVFARHGRLDIQFFTLLRKARPYREGEIRCVQVQALDTDASLDVEDDEVTQPGVPAFVPTSGPDKTYDIFLSHASDDKQPFVKGLYDALRARGLQVWYDAAEIELGDDFRQKMRAGLKTSQFGVVVLSPRFFRYWPEQEVSALFTLDSATKRKKILPVLLDLTWEQLVAQDPFLGARASASASDGAQKVADQIFHAIQKEKSRHQPSPDERMQALLDTRTSMERKGEDTSSISNKIIQLKRELRSGST